MPLEGEQEQYIEVEGTPDWVLEIVSKHSVQKDTQLLRAAYFRAGIPEYWLIDARTEPLKFDILRRTAKGYVSVRRQNGWVKSSVFHKSFRLTRALDDQENPEYTLAVR